VIVGDVAVQPGARRVARRFAGRPGDGEVDAARVQLVDDLQQHASPGEVDIVDAGRVEHEEAGRRRGRRHLLAHPVAEARGVGEVQRRVDPVGHHTGHGLGVGAFLERPPHGRAGHPAQQRVARPGAAPGAVEDGEHDGQQDAGADAEEHDRAQGSNGHTELDLVESVNGVQVVSAPQLFPTPDDVAARMVELARLEPGECVLEPSAGTGSIVRAVLKAVDTEVLAYEINQGLASQLTRSFAPHKLQVRCRDFLEVSDFQGCYPVVLMNPPFDHASDIKHIRHALTFLAPGGRLVAICANGPRQQEALRPLASHWEELPAGTFEGTGVRAALLVIEKAADAQAVAA